LQHNMLEWRGGWSTRSSEPLIQSIRLICLYLRTRDSKPGSGDVARRRSAAADAPAL